MEGFKNTTRMKTFGDVAPQAYAKGGSVKSAAKVGKVMGEFAEGKLHSGSKTGPKVTNKKQAIAIGISEAKKAPMKKANGGTVRMTDAERRASLEVPSKGMTPAEARALRATMAAKAAAPKRGPLIQSKNSNPMSPAEVRRLIEMDRPTNKMGAEAYKGGGKVGASKVPFAVKKVMRKAEGGAVNQPPPIPEMPNQPAPPPPLATSPSQPTPMPVGYDVTPAPMKPPASASDIIRAQQAAEMMRLMGGTSPGPSPEMPSADSGMVQLTPGYIDNNGNRVEATYGQQSPQPQFYDRVYTPKNSPEMFAADRARVAAAQARAQAQQMQEQRDAAQIRREAAPRFMR